MTQITASARHIYPKVPVKDADGKPTGKTETRRVRIGYCEIVGSRGGYAFHYKVTQTRRKGRDRYTVEVEVKVCYNPVLLLGAPPKPVWKSFGPSMDRSQFFQFLEGNALNAAVIILQMDYAEVA